MTIRQRRPLWLRAASVAAAFAVTIAIVPRQLCGQPAQPLFDEAALTEIAKAMQDTQDELIREGNPRNAIPGETGEAAPV